MKTNIRLPGWGSSQVAVLIHYAQSQGLAVESILADSGITECMLEQNDPTLNQELVVIKNMLNLLSVHPFKLGLNVGRMCNVNSFGLFGQVLAASDSAKDIMKVLSNFLNGEHDFVKVHPRIKFNKIITTFDAPDDLPEDIAQFMLGRSMGSSITIQENVLAGRPSPTMEVGFMGRELPGMIQIGELYNCEVKFQQPSNYLHCHISALNMALPLGNRLLSSILFKRVGHYLYSMRGKSTQNENIHERIAQLLNQAEYKNISKEKIASELNMSSRTLSRHLLREGTNWSDLYTKLRMERAKELLATSSERLDTIALKVGFLSSSAFSNAFSRKIGKSPHEYRINTVNTVKASF